MIRVALHVNGDYWQLRWVAPDGRRMCRGAGLRAEVSRRRAEGLRARLERDLNSGAVAPGACPTIDQWVKHHRETRRVKDSTAAMQDGSIDKYLLSYFGGGLRMDAVSLVEVQRWVKWLGRQPGISSDWTVAGHLRVAQSLWAGSVQAHGGRNPFALVRVKTPDATPFVPNLTEADVLRVCGAASPDWRAALGLCGLAGLRAGEAAAMTWDRVLWDRGRLLVPQAKVEGSKGRKDRACLLEPSLARLLLDCRETARAREPRVTTAHLRNATRDVPPIVVRAGLAPWPAPLQSLRRWRASSWRSTYPEFVVNAWLGHSQRVASRFYVDVPESFYGGTEADALRQRVAELEAALNRHNPATNPA